MFKSIFHFSVVSYFVCGLSRDALASSFWWVLPLFIGWKITFDNKSETEESQAAQFDQNKRL